MKTVKLLTIAEAMKKENERRSAYCKDFVKKWNKILRDVDQKK